MSKLYQELNKEMEKQQEFVQRRTSSQTDAAMSDTDAVMSDTDAGHEKHPLTLDREKLKIIISELSALDVSGNTTSVRISEAEQQDIKDFIYITLRQNDIQGKAVSSAKLMRYAIRYMMKVHPNEFVDALSEALKKRETLSI